MRRYVLHSLLIIASGTLWAGAAWALRIDPVGIGFWGGVGAGFALGCFREERDAPASAPVGQSSALEVDPTGEIAYLRVQRGRHGYTVAEIPCVNADFDKDGNLLGIEFEVWPLDDRPAVPQAWPPYEGYDEAQDRRQERRQERDNDNDNEGEEWKR